VHGETEIFTEREYLADTVETNFKRRRLPFYKNDLEDEKNNVVGTSA